MKHYGKGALLVKCIVLLFVFPFLECTIRYYGGYFIYGTGDTYITVFHNHGGNILPHRKWIVECLDGEAMVGIQDWTNDFERLQMIYCKFMFSRKPPTQGLYPYFPSCHVRNYTANFFCYDAQNSSATLNTFITAFEDNDFLWQVQRPGQDDNQPYKCCKTPEGYYIDYVSCYYMPTHDIYREYYDAQNQFIVQCATGYIMTGIAKKINPYTQLYNIDWIQCCRLGFGPPVAYPPPVSFTKNGGMVYKAGYFTPSQPVPVSYKRQYRSVQKDSMDLSSCKPSNNTDDLLHHNSHRYQKIKFQRPEFMLHANPIRRLKSC